MRPSDAAELLNVHPRTVVRWAQAGRLVSEVTGTGMHLVSRAAVLELARKRTEHAPEVVQAAARLAELAHHHRLTRGQAYALVDGWWPGE